MKKMNQTIHPKQQQNSHALSNGTKVTLRPIKKQDQNKWLEMFNNFSQESIRNRFFQMIHPTKKLSQRYCNINQIDEIAIIAQTPKKKIIGVVRLSIQSNINIGEISFIVADPWQGLGVGSKLIDHIIQIAKEKNLNKIFAQILPNNFKTINILKRKNFTFQYQDQYSLKATLNVRTKK